MKLILILGLLTSAVFASDNDKLHMPKSFNAEGGRAVFADFSEAVYQITYNLTEKKASVLAEIKLETHEDGFPIFDSVTAPAAVSLDGVLVPSVETKTPNGETTLRLVKKFTSAGQHVLQIEVPLTNLVEFTETGVKSAFWTSDLSERRFLESYMPANFEFDQVKMTFIVKYVGFSSRQNIYTNGVMTLLDSATAKITFPAYYTASSIFFHTVPLGATSELRFSLKSIDGRNIPAVVYFAAGTFGSLQNLKTKTSEVFHELESDYGPFPHPSITVLQAGRGGMEYCGATMTEVSALGHELFHSYFARGVMPANGNAGWVDEALASWRDEGYQTLDTLAGTSGMSSHLYYTRTTDKAAYSFGERFMRYMDGKLKVKGGLKPFMRHMVDKKVFNPFFIEEFMREMSSFYGTSVEQDFRRYTFGLKDDFPEMKKSSHSHHQKMSLEELRKYL